MTTTVFEMQEKLLSCVGVSGRHPELDRRKVNAGLVLPFDDQEAALRTLAVGPPNGNVVSTCALFALHGYLVQILGLGAGQVWGERARKPYYTPNSGRIGGIFGDLLNFGRDAGLMLAPGKKTDFGTAGADTNKVVEIAGKLIERGDVTHIGTPDHASCVYKTEPVPEASPVRGLVPKDVLVICYAYCVDGGQVDNSWIMERTRLLVWYRNRFYLVDPDRPFTGAVPRGRMVLNVIKASRCLSAG